MKHFLFLNPVNVFYAEVCTGLLQVMSFKGLFIVLLSAWLSASGREGEEFSVVFWNLENFFDCKDSGTGPSDAEFTPEGERRWTAGRYWKKCNAVAKTFMWLAGRDAGMPAVAGVAEVEDRGVVQSVLNGTLLRKYDYVTVHEDSPDPRGIDVALIYRESMFLKVSSKVLPVREDADGNPFRTRDILHVCLARKPDGERFHFLVNHHPSKFGGAVQSGRRRLAAMSVMMRACDSLMSAGETNIICMGDFNDTPDGEAFRIVDSRFENLGIPLHERGKGTIRYRGKWELIDMFIVSREISARACMEICLPDFLSVRDNAHSGFRPLRTYTGPRYSGGVSDHAPIVLVVKK